MQVVENFRIDVPQGKLNETFALLTKALLEIEALKSISVRRFGTSINEFVDQEHVEDKDRVEIRVIFQEAAFFNTVVRVSKVHSTFLAGYIVVTLDSKCPYSLLEAWAQSNVNISDIVDHQTLLLDSLLDKIRSTGSVLEKVFQIKASLQMKEEMLNSHIKLVHDQPSGTPGLTIKQENALMKHSIPIGTLVRVACEYSPEDGVQAFVVAHTRDCDQTPLYALTANWDDVAFFLEHPDLDISLPAKGELSAIGHARSHGRVNGFSEESLVVVNDKALRDWITEGEVHQELTSYKEPPDL